ncbi:MAG: type II secretion system protein GspN [Nitrospirae bacterium]|nr:type II secretion system protein GspN [Nitrospirota bacterium]
MLSQAWNTVKNRSNLTRILLYLLYFAILFFLFLYLLFPYDKLKERLIYEAESKSALKVSINKLTPLLFNGIWLKDVEVFHRDNPKGAPLFKGDIGLRFSLFRLIRRGIAVKGDIRAYNGEAIVNITDRKIQGDIKGIDLGAYTALKGLYDVDAAGIMSGRLDAASGADIFSGSSLNLEKINGEARFNIANLSVKNLKILGLKLPDTFFDAVQSELRINDGRLNIKRLSLEGRELNIQVTGDIILAREISSSPMNIIVRIKPSVRFEEENKIFFSMGKAKDGEGFYNINIRGTLRTPNLS